MSLARRRHRSRFRKHDRTRAAVDRRARAAHSDGGGDFDVGSGANHVEITSAANVIPDGIVGFVLEPNLIPATVLRVAPRVLALGIQVGDQIVAVDGLDTSNMVADEVNMLIAGKGPGATVSLKLARGVTIRVPLFPDN